MKIKTYFENLDIFLGEGLECPSLVAIGARPAMGKTSFINTLAMNFIKKEINFHYLTFDSNKKQVIDKISKLIDFDFYSDYLSCFEDRNDISHIDEYCKFIDDYSKECKIFLIDYYQLFLTNENQSAYLETSYILTKLKHCCLKNGVTILISSQLNRKVEERPGNRPFLNDFRDSGVIEEISDVILFIFRRDYYNPDDKPCLAEIIIAKNKYGDVGSCHFNFDKNKQQFTERVFIEERKIDPAFSYFSPN
jgi:replicative DNA helicase